MNIFTFKDEELIGQIITKNGKDYIIIEGMQERVWGEHDFFFKYIGTRFVLNFEDKHAPYLEISLGNSAGAPTPVKTTKEALKALSQWRNLYKYKDLECGIDLYRHSQAIYSHDTYIEKRIPLPNCNLKTTKSSFKNVILCIKYHDGSAYEFGIGPQYCNSNFLKDYFKGESKFVYQDRPIIPVFGLDLLAYNIGNVEYRDRMSMKFECFYHSPDKEESKIKSLLDLEQKIIKYNAEKAADATCQVGMYLDDSKKSIKELILHDDYNEYLRFEKDL